MAGTRFKGVRGILQEASSLLYLPEIRAEWSADAVTFGIQVTADLHGVTRLPLIDVIICGRFGEEGVPAGKEAVRLVVIRRK